jgi:hypothetical protein
MSVGAVKVAVHRLRRQYQEFLREEISQTVSSQIESMTRFGICLQVSEINLVAVNPDVFGHFCGVI